MLHHRLNIAGKVLAKQWQESALIGFRIEKVLTSDQEGFFSSDAGDGVEICQ